jgi:SAM-dependent methyltransferase
MGEIEDIPFWLQLAKEKGGPVLELGCGTGRLLLPLLKAGIDVIGLDIDFEMLSHIKSQLSPQMREQVNFFQADLDNYHLERRFSMIFLACNTLSTLQKETRLNAYSRIREHLKSDGIFAVSIPNPINLASLSAQGESEIEVSFSHPLTGNPIQVSSEWQLTDRFVEFYWHYDHLLPDGLVDRETIRSRHSLISPGEYQAELQSANLNPINLYGDFEKADFQKDSPYLIIIAQKRPGFL